MFANKQTTRQLLAFGVVAMFVLCAFTVVAESSEGSVYGGVSTNNGTDAAQAYTIPISVGQTFTYDNIKTNLSGASETYGSVTIVGTGTAISNSYLSFSDNNDGTYKLSGTFPSAAAGNSYKALLTATWTSPAGDDGKTEKQTATQELTFNVKAALSIASDATSKTINVQDTSATSGSTIATIPYTGAVVTGAEPSTITGTDASKFTVSTTPNETNTGGNIVIKAASNLSVTSTTLTFTLTITNSDTANSDSMTVNVNVYDKIGFTNEETTYYTYQNSKTYTSFVFEDTYQSDKNNNTVSTAGDMTFSDNNTSGVLSKGTDGYTVVIDTSKAPTIGASTYYADYTATLTVNGSITSDDGVTVPTQSSSASATFKLRVFDSLMFTTAPTTSNITAASVGNSTNTMTLSTYISGATKVTFNWGDGTSTETVGGSSNSTYSSLHTYKNSGMYMITISASNDVGNTESKVMYSVDSDLTVDGNTTTDDSKDTTSGDKSLKDTVADNWLAIAIICIVAGVLGGFILYGYNNLLGMIVGAILVIIAIAAALIGNGVL